MPETLSVRPVICDQIRSGPLGRWVDDFVDVLITRGYATSTVRRHVRAAAIFSVWLDQQRVAATDIDETLVTRFVTGLPRRPSSTRPERPALECGKRRPSAGRASMDPRGSGAPCPRSPRPMRGRAVAAALRRSPRASTWLGCRDPAEVPPLCRSLSYRLRGNADARLVPAHRADDRSVRAGPGQRAWSVVLACPGYSHPCVSSASWPPVVWFPASIEGAVPTIREWKHATLPRALTDDDVQRVLAAVDDTRPNGRRDRAILLLLRPARPPSRRGRSAQGEGHRLAQRGCPCSRQRKTGAKAAVAGRCRGGLGRHVALAAPDQLTGCDLRHCAAAVSAAHRFDRVGHRRASAASRRRHRPAARRPTFFRHTVASQMVCRDVPIKTIGDLLGHARLKTTTIYAKLDRETLATIALPWPGGAR